MIWHLIIIVLCVLTSSICSALTCSVITVSQAKVEEYSKESHWGASRLSHMLSERSRYINALVLIRTIGQALTAVFTYTSILKFFDSFYATLVAIFVIVFVDYTCVGYIARTLGRVHAYTYACTCAGFIEIITKLFHPLTVICNKIGQAFIPGSMLRNSPFDVEVELREMVDLAQETGEFNDEERKMIQAIFDFGKATARSVMIPRTELVWIESTKTVSQALKLAVRSGYSRIPVIGKDVDDILGVLYVKDLLHHIATLNTSISSISTPLTELVRTPQFYPDTKPLDNVLAQMQQKRRHMAFLVNEYGSIAGIVTMEDIVEEIVGEIADEYDQEEIMPVVQLGEDSYRLSARVSLETAGELFGVDFDHEKYEGVDTVLGLVGLLLERIPLPGSTVRAQGLIFTTEGGKDRRGRNRIRTIVVQRLAHSDEIKT